MGRGGPGPLRGSVLDPWKKRIDAIIAADAGSPRRRSVRVIVEQLEITDVSSETVWAYVSTQRRQLRAARQDDRP